MAAHGVIKTTIKFALVWLEPRPLTYRHQGKGIYEAAGDSWLLELKGVDVAKG
ncbi:hypothetical protein [Micromonospora haikouensis]|uniref:hypothetical protein n=1 Tax=Micromonospora haikouensis TaxID=686309 RepID=UPI003D90CB1A